MIRRSKSRVGPALLRLERIRESVRWNPVLLRILSTLASGYLKHAAEALNPGLQPGDLVLLKGSNRADHLVRILLARTSQVECWRHACPRAVSCEICRLRRIPAPV
jgi:hypothetical protein